MTEEIEFKLINSNSSPSRKLMMVPAEGDMNYLYLSISQARYLLEELNQSLKNENDADILVVAFPKEEKGEKMIFDALTIGQLKAEIKDLPEGQTQYLDENGNTVGEIKPLGTKSLMNQSIDVLDITQRTKNDLKYCGVFTISDLQKCKLWKTSFFGMFLDDKKKIELALNKESKNEIG